MVAYKDILYATTKLISNNFDCDVFVKDSEGLFSNECFYIKIIPVLSRANTKITNFKSLMISIKYFNGDKLRNYEVLNILEDLFSRTLKVKDRFLKISNTESNFIEDEVDEMLDFLVYIDFIDDIKQDAKEFDNMEDINIEMEG